MRSQASASDNRPYVNQKTAYRMHHLARRPRALDDRACTAGSNAPEGRIDLGGRSLWGGSMQASNMQGYQ